MFKCEKCNIECTDEFGIMGFGIVCEKCSYNFATHLIKIKTVNIELTNTERKTLSSVLLNEIVKQDICSKKQTETLIRIFYKIGVNFLEENEENYGNQTNRG